MIAGALGLVLAVTLGLAACSATQTPAVAQLQSRPVGTGPRFRIDPVGSSVARARPVAGLVCSRRGPRRFGVHLELFADDRVVIVPAGIGIAPPHSRGGAYVVGGRCSYPARTLEPTGVIQVTRGARVTLGQFFALWGQPLGRHRFAGFRGRPGDPVLAFVDGRPWLGDPRTIPLRRHANIVLELGGYVLPHSRYVFRPGL